MMMLRHAGFQHGSVDFKIRHPRDLLSAIQVWLHFPLPMDSRFHGNDEKKSGILNIPVIIGYADVWIVNPVRPEPVEGLACLGSWFDKLTTNGKTKLITNGKARLTTNGKTKLITNGRVLCISKKLRNAGFKIRHPRDLLSGLQVWLHFPLPMHSHFHGDDEVKNGILNIPITPPIDSHFNGNKVILGVMTNENLQN